MATKGKSKKAITIEGVCVEKNGNATICRIKSISTQFEELIRSRLREICHGKAEIKTYGKGLRSYSGTIQSFIQRYKKKNNNIRLGMMGELLAHLLLGEVFKHFRVISIYFNKEEQSVKKGFDLIFFSLDEKSIWYAEVKTGEKRKAKTTDQKNAALLRYSNSSLKKLLSGSRTSIWNNAMIDVSLTVGQSKKSSAIKALLENDQPGAVKNINKKNAILISVLFHDIDEKVTVGSLKTISDLVSKQEFFGQHIMFSIQKSTLSMLEKFLTKEAQTAAD